MRPMQIRWIIFCSIGLFIAFSVRRLEAQVTTGRSATLNTMFVQPDIRGMAFSMLSSRVSDVLGKHLKRLSDDRAPDEPGSRSSLILKPDVRVGLFSNSRSMSIGAGLQFGITENVAVQPALEFSSTNTTTSLFFSADTKYYKRFLEINPYIGAGLGFFYTDFSNIKDADVGLNALLGVDFGDRNAFTPYLQLKTFFSDRRAIQVSGGIRF
jgi:hypothetical protein